MRKQRIQTMLIKIDSWEQLTAVVKLLYSKEAKSKHCDRFMPDFIHDELCFGYSGANGALENLLQDTNSDDPEYKAAKATLQDRDQLVLEVYHAATTELYEDGINVFGPQCARVLKDLKFLGREKIMELVRAEVDEQIRNGIEIPKE